MLYIYDPTCGACERRRRRTKMALPFTHGTKPGNFTTIKWERLRLTNNRKRGRCFNNTAHVPQVVHLKYEPTDFFRPPALCMREGLPGSVLPISRRCAHMKAHGLYGNYRLIQPEPLRSRHVFTDGTPCLVTSAEKEYYNTHSLWFVKKGNSSSRRRLLPVL